MKRIYFDTIIYNDICKDSHYFSKVKNDINNKKYQLYFSPINLWEILSNPNINQAYSMINKIKELTPIFLKNPNECLSYIYLQIIKQITNNQDICINLIDNFKATNEDIWHINFKHINDSNIDNICIKANKESKKFKKNQILRQYIFASFYAKLITSLPLPKDIKKNYLIDNFIKFNINNIFMNMISDVKNQKINIDYTLNDFYKTDFKNKCKILNILKDDIAYIEIRSQLKELENDEYLIANLKFFYINPDIIINSILNNENKITYFTNNDFLVFYSQVIIGTALSILLNKRHPKITEGDLFDWEQLVYSEIVDRFFTKDKRFYDIIRKANYNIDKFEYLDNYNKM